MKKFEASKVILIFIFLLLFIVIGFTMFMTWTISNITALIPIIIGTFVLSGSAIGFYYWKAKAENIEKIRKSREKRNSGHVEMNDIMSIPDNGAAVMASALSGVSIDANTPEYSEEETEYIEEEGGEIE